MLAEHPQRVFRGGFKEIIVGGHAHPQLLLVDGKGQAGHGAATDGSVTVCGTTEVLFEFPESLAVPEVI
jgi:hypothetical protein